jgi:iron complex outermembrane receptor protein
MQRTPETQFNTGFEWTAGSGSWEDALLFRLAYTWQDEMPWAHTNVSWEDSYGLFDGRIALAPQNAAWEVSVWGRNLTDEEYRANVIEFLGGDMAIYNPPRTYGLDVTWKF